MSKHIIRNWAWIFLDHFEQYPKPYWQDIQHLTSLFRKDYHVMANTNTKKQTNPTLQAKWANANITSEHATEIHEIVASGQQPMEYILSLVADGCSFSIKYREDKSDYIAYIFEPDVDNPKQSYGLSAYASDIRTALVVLCYKHDTILRGYAGNGITETSSFG